MDVEAVSGGRCVVSGGNAVDCDSTEEGEGAAAVAVYRQSCPLVGGTTTAQASVMLVTAPSRPICPWVPFGR